LSASGGNRPARHRPVYLAATGGSLVVVTTTVPRVIGMLGGMSWESSAQYYRVANELVRERLGGLHSARVV